MYVGPLSSTRRRRLEKGLRSRDAFEPRRCQILLASAGGQRPSQLAAYLGCTAQTVRNTIRTYRADTMTCLRAQSSRPKSVAPVLDEAKREWLRAIVHESPRSFGKPTSLWTLRLLAEVCFVQGVTSRAYRVDAARSQADGSGMETGQALDHQSAIRNGLFVAVRLYR